MSHITLRLTRADLDSAALIRGPCFTKAVLETAVIEGDKIAIAGEEWARLSVVHRTPAVSEPTLSELAANFSGAIMRWVKAGAPVSSQEVYGERSAVCDACQYWDGTARLGLGKCSAPGCGCTSMKRWLQTERCPLGKWAR
jgi:hypothetical protein